MQNQKIVEEWMQFAEMDYKTAIIYTKQCIQNHWRLYVIIASRLLKNC